MQLGLSSSAAASSACFAGKRLPLPPARPTTGSRSDRFCALHVRAKSAGTSADDLPPAGCSRIPVTLGKPLGVVLEANKAGDIFVVDVVPTGAAARSKLVEVGDQLIATSAVIYNTTREYGGVNVKGGQERVRLLVKGEKFDTVMAAISSHPGTMQVVLELQKCKPLTPEQVALLNADKTKK